MAEEGDKPPSLESDEDEQQDEEVEFQEEVGEASPSRPLAPAAATPSNT